MRPLEKEDKMRIYATRRECEILLNCLYSKMSTLKLEEMQEYNKLADRIIAVTSTQCKDDHSTYKEEKK